MIVVLIIALIIVLLYSVVVTIGMLRGLKKTELYEDIFKNIKDRSNAAYANMKEIDSLGAFEADDDVGDVFKELKNIVDELNKYITENTNEQKNNNPE